MKNFFLLILFFIDVSLNAHYLLQTPSPITQQEILQIPRCWTGVWRRSNGLYMLNFDEDRIGFNIIFFNSIPHGIEQEKFKKIERNNRIEFEYKIGYFDPRMEEDSINTSHDSYYLSKPLKFVDNNPQELSIQDLTTIIQQKNIIFYTGAGISAAADIFTLKPLMENLGIVDMKSDQFVYDVLNNPEKTTTIFKEFCNKAFCTPATPAHRALTDIAMIKKTQIVTENFDLLHEQTGIKPIHLDAPSMSNNVTPEELQQIDVILCIEISHDDRGFLAWYKHHNPRGIIIAVNLATPSYLNTDDFIVHGDLQTIMPELRDRVIATIVG